MSDVAEILITLPSGERLAITVRALGGSVAVAAHDAPAERPPQQSRPGGRPQGRPSIVPALNAARKDADLDNREGTAFIAAAVGVDKLTVLAVEEWIAEEARGNVAAGLRELMKRATAIRRREEGSR